MDQLDKILNNVINIDYKPIDANRAWDSFAQQHQVKEQQNKLRLQKRRKIIRITRLAAIFIFLIVASNVFWPEKEIYKTQTTLENAQIITMVDGTEIRLNKNSEITFPVDLKDLSERIITLKGDATFDVQHNPNKPFIVKYDNLLVEVLGTKFTLEKINNSDIVIENHEGSVKASDVDNPDVSIILNKGDKMKFTPTGFINLVIKKPKKEPEAVIDHSKVYSFSEIYNFLNHKTNGAVELHHEADFHENGQVKIDLTQSIYAILRELQLKTNIKYIYTHQDTILIKRFLPIEKEQ